MLPPYRLETPAFAEGTPSRCVESWDHAEAPLKAAAAACIEIVPVNKVVIDDHAVVAPAGMPTISTPAAPASPEKESHLDAQSESEVTAAHERRVIPVRVRIIERRAPDRAGIIIGQVQHARIYRLNVDDRLPAVVHCAHSLLARRSQCPGLLASEPHPLDCIHHFRLLSEKCVSKICSPRDVSVQALHKVRKDHKGLYARVPVLLLCCLGESAACEPRVPLEPLLRLHKFKRIGGGH